MYFYGYSFQHVLGSRLMENIRATKRSGRVLCACSLDMLVSQQCDGQMSQILAVVCVCLNGTDLHFI